MKSPAKPGSDCGDPCKALSKRQHEVHLLHLEGFKADECWLKTHGRGRKPSKTSCHSAGSRMLKSVEMVLAFQHHRKAAEVRYWRSEDRSMARLAAVAEGADLAWFLTRTGEIDVSKVTGKDDRTRALKTIEWYEEGVIKKITLNSGAVYEAAMAKRRGWDAPVKYLDVTPIESELEAAAAAGDESAEEALAKIAAGDDPTGGDFAKYHAEWKAGRKRPAGGSWARGSSGSVG